MDSGGNSGVAGFVENALLRARSGFGTPLTFRGVVAGQGWLPGVSRALVLLFQQLIEAGALSRGKFFAESLFGALQFLANERGDRLHDFAGAVLTFLENAVNAFTLLGGGSATVDLQFAPNAAGFFTNSVIITTANGGNSTNPVTGRGVRRGQGLRAPR